MGIKRGPTLVRDGLVLHLDAANPRSYPGSGTTWFDLSGNSNHFTLYNGVGFSQESKGCLTFDGANDYAASTNNLNLSIYDYVAVEVLYKTNTTITTSMIFEHTVNWNSNAGGFGLAVNSNGSGNLANCNHTNHNTGVARNYLVTNNLIWNNHVNLYSKVADTTGRLSYINSELTAFSSTNGYGTGTTTGVGQFANATFFIGSRGGLSIFTNGSIASVKVYGFKINQPQIEQNYTAQKSRFGL